MILCLLTEESEHLNPHADPYMVLYPYWTVYPKGWDYPAACASGKSGQGGWAASIDQQDGKIFQKLQNAKL